MIEASGKANAPKVATPTIAQATPKQVAPAEGSGFGAKELWGDEVEKEHGTNLKEKSNPKDEGEPKFTNWAELFKGNRAKENGWTLEYSPPDPEKKVVVITPEE